MLIVYAGLVVIGLVLLLVGYAIVSTATVYNEQDSGITLAVAGTAIANIAGVLLLLAGWRVVTNRRVAVLGAVPALRIRSAGTGPASSSTLVGGEGLTRYHRADCPMAAGRDWPPVSAAEHERAGRSACGVCRP